jgi:hypothetical protein
MVNYLSQLGKNVFFVGLFCALPASIFTVIARSEQRGNRSEAEFGGANDMGLTLPTIPVQVLSRI